MRGNEWRRTPRALTGHIQALSIRQSESFALVENRLEDMRVLPTMLAANAQQRGPWTQFV